MAADSHSPATRIRARRQAERVALHALAPHSALRASRATFNRLPAPQRLFGACRRMARAWGLAILLPLILSAAHAQSVRWEAADPDDPSALQLIFENCAPEGDPQLPTIEGVTFSQLGRSEQTSIVNLSMTRTTVISYRARAQRAGPLRIPAFTVQTNKGAIRVPAFNSAAVAESNVTSRIELSSPSVWAGEVFSLTYVLDVSRRAFNQLGSNLEWDASPLVVEDWSKFEPSEAQVGGETRLRVTSRTRGYAKTPGAVTLHAANQLVNLQSGSIGFGLFQTPRIEQLAVTSNQPPLMVRALPTPPPGFSGAVGQFKLSSKIIPTNATVGEPITWTLELTGTGNWPEIAGLPQRSVSKDFNVVQPQARRTPAEGKLFDSTLTEDVVLVPTRAGSYTLEPVSFVYFDPALGRYQTVSTPRQTVTIAAPPPPPTPTPESTAPAKAEPAPEAAPTAPRIPPPPTTPLGIPRDPLPGSTTAMVPLSGGLLAGLVILPFALLLCFWAWLAVRRAQMTDRERHRRAAKERLTATLGALRTARGPAGAAVRAQLLLQWQRDTAVLWQIRHAAPSATVFVAEPEPPVVAGRVEADPAATPATTKPAASVGQNASSPAARRSTADSHRLVWAGLWRAADRALYSPDAELPVDWVDRAEAALAEKRVPGFRVHTALLPRNLLPFVAVLALLGVLAPRVAAETAAVPTTSAAAAAQAYRRGEFAVAAKAWAELLARNPTDAIARHNLSLALAQQDRWGEAAAHAAAAFVQRPRNEPVQWQLALAAGKAGYIPAALAGFLPAGPVQALARLASPGAWQMILAAAAALFAAAIAVLLLGAYHHSSRLRVWLALAVMGFAFVMAGAALTSLHAFGPTANRRAVIAWRAGTLRSIPTEADTTQKTTPLPAGSVGLAGQTFLGWVQLTFDNGQTGWVRQDDLIALWR